MDRIDDEMSEVDRAAQADPVTPDDEQDQPSSLEIGTKEVDEADAVEQSRAVPIDEDYPHG